MKTEKRYLILIMLVLVISGFSMIWYTAGFKVAVAILIFQWTFNILGTYRGISKKIQIK